MQTAAAAVALDASRVTEVLDRAFSTPMLEGQSATFEFKDVSPDVIKVPHGSAGTWS